MNDSIGTRAVRGVAWLGSGQLVRQSLAFVTNIALARMLFPDDFGLFGMAFAAAEIAQILTDFGLGAAIVQRRETHPTTLTTCFWLNLIIGLSVSLLLLASAPLLVAYFGHSEIELLMLPLALNMLIGASLVVPSALLVQKMRFREITLAQTAGSIAASIGSITLAINSAGVLALALQPLIGNIVTGACMFSMARWVPFGCPRLSSVRHMLSFSGHLLGNNLLGVIGRNLHAAILGRMLGSHQLGLYNLASGMTGTILFQISSVIIRVLFPTLSNIRDEPERLREAWFKACSAIGIMAFPAMAGMIAVAPDFVPVIFGPQWVYATDVLRILCAVMAVQCVLTTSGTVLMALGRADLLLYTSMASIPAIGLGLWLGALHHGVEGAALGYAVAGIGTYLLVTTLACRESGVRIGLLVSQLFPWAIAAISMALGVVGLASVLDGISALLRLIVCVSVGVLLYTGILLLFIRSRTLSLLFDVRSRLSGSSP